MARIAQWIPLEYIDVSAKQLRKVDRHKVEHHRQSYECDDLVHPIDVIAHGDSIHGLRYRILGNGRHRFFGAKAAGLSAIECIVHDSSLSKGGRPRARGSFV